MPINSMMLNAVRHSSRAKSGGKTTMGKEKGKEEPARLETVTLSFPIFKLDAGERA